MLTDDYFTKQSQECLQALIELSNEYADCSMSKGEFLAKKEVLIKKYFKKIELDATKEMVDLSIETLRELKKNIIGTLGL